MFDNIIIDPKAAATGKAAASTVLKSAAYSDALSLMHERSNLPHLSM